MQREKRFNRNPRERSRRSGSSWSERHDILAAGGLAAAFLALGFSNFMSPGYMPDGFDNEMAAALWAEAARGATPLVAPAPLSWSPLFHGRVVGQLMAPFFLAFGTSWTLVRSWPLVWGALTIVAAFLFTRELFGRRPALLCAALLAFHPPFLMAVKIGNIHTSSMIFFSTGALYALARWRTSRRNGWLFAASLLTGLGIGTKLWFMWFAVALAVAGIFFLKSDLSAPGRRRDLAAAFSVAALGLAIGAGPVLLTEMSSGFESASEAFRWSYQYGGARSAPYWVRFPYGLLAVAREVGSFLKADVFFESYFEAAHDRSNFLYPAAFWISLAACAGLALRQRKDGVRFAWPAALFSLIFLQAAASKATRDFEAGHLLVFYPLPQVLISVAVSELAERLKKRKPLAAGLAGLLLLFGVLEVRSLGAYFERMRGPGVTGYLSDAVYSLADWLAVNPAGDGPMLMSTSLFRNLHLIRPDLGLPYRANVRGRLFSLYATPAELEQAIQAATPGPRSFTVVLDGHHQEQYYPTPHLLDWARRRGAPLRLLAAFPNKDGSSGFEVYLGSLPQKIVSPRPTPRGLREAPPYRVPYVPLRPAGPPETQ